jgi:NitT/TauT family transport system permease protein
MKIFGHRVPMMFSLVVWLVVWEIIGQAEWMLLIPPFSDVLRACFELLGSESFHKSAGVTLSAFASGMGIAIAAGVPLGVLMGRIDAVDRLLGMWVNVFVSAPLTALVPIIMILFGFGQTTIIVTVLLFAIWIIVLDTRAGIRNVNPSLIDMARAFSASRFQLYTRVLILAALPEILAGIRLGLIRGVKGVVIGQLLVAIVGLGELFELYSRNFLMDKFWAVTILLFAFAIAASSLIEMLERRVEYYAGARG